MLAWTEVYRHLRDTGASPATTVATRLPAGGTEGASPNIMCGRRALAVETVFQNDRIWQPFVIADRDPLVEWRNRL
jgi:hypothetical protein